MMNNPAPGILSHWLAYVDVDDVGAATRRQALEPPSPREDGSPDFGWFSVIDPTGAASPPAGEIRPVAATGLVEWPGPPVRYLRENFSISSRRPPKNVTERQ
jgi:hypothetical protein